MNAATLPNVNTCSCAFVIVPDGVLFGSSKAHRELRRVLVDDQKLDAIVKLPSGVFKPYAGVSTAIALFTKGIIGRLPILLAVFALAGCGIFKDREANKSDWGAADFYKAAKEQFDSGSWDAAIKLYERVGMRQTRQFDCYEKRGI